MEWFYPLCFELCLVFFRLSFDVTRSKVLLLSLWLSLSFDWLTEAMLTFAKLLALKLLILFELVDNFNDAVKLSWLPLRGSGCL